MHSRRDPGDILSGRHYARARRRALHGDFDGSEWETMVAWYGSVCLACGTMPVTVDHVVPLVVGGSNDISNLQPLCASCNSRKGQDMIDFRDPLRLVQLLEMLG